MSEFIWTENLVEEFLTHRDSKRRLWEDFEMFKQSKQQSKNNQDWEILSFRKEGLTYLLTSGKYYDEFGGYYKTVPESCEIKSVKVLSSGEVFSIGDKVSTTVGNTCIIDGFQITPSNEIRILSNSHCFPTLNNAKKIKQPLFTTEDGKPIYENDRYWVYSLYNENISEQTAINGYAKKYPKLRCFSTEEAAKEYKLMNKPCLSLNDVLNYYDSVVNRFADFRHGLKELVKNKINQ